MPRRARRSSRVAVKSRRNREGVHASRRNRLPDLASFALAGSSVIRTIVIGAIVLLVVTRVAVVVAMIAAIVGARLLVLVAVITPMLLPLRALAIEWSRAVVAIPIVADREGDCRQGETRSVLEDRHATIVVRIRELARIHPPAIRAEVDVAPAVIGDATVHVDGHASAERRHHRIVVAGSRMDLRSAR